MPETVPEDGKSEAPCGSGDTMPSPSLPLYRDRIRNDEINEDAIRVFRPSNSAKAWTFFGKWPPMHDVKEQNMVYEKENYTRMGQLIYPAWWRRTSDNNRVVRLTTMEISHG